MRGEPARVDPRVGLGDRGLLAGRHLCAPARGDLPDRFGSWIDVSGQRGRRSATKVTPSSGVSRATERRTAAQPLRILADRAPYTASAAFIAAGADDSRYGPIVPVVRAGRTGRRRRRDPAPVEDGGHDWHTAGTALAEGVEWFMRRTHLAR